jgi:phage baseplate assembly protein gpV
MADNRVALHQGQTTERDVKSASARVGFDDLSGTVSGFMQVLFPAAGGWNFFYTPKEGDQVVVSRLPNGAEEGYILGKVYTAGKMP